MPMSKKRTIYKPKKGKRISQKKLYKLPKQHGGDFMADVKNFLQLTPRRRLFFQAEFVNGWKNKNIFND